MVHHRGQSCRRRTRPKISEKSAFHCIDLSAIMAALELLWPISGSRRALRYDRKARGRCGASKDAHRSALRSSSNLAPARVSALDVPQLSYPAARGALAAATAHDRPHVQRAALYLDGIRRWHGRSASDRYHRASPAGSTRAATTAASSRQRDGARSARGSSPALIARRCFARANVSP